MMDDHRESLMAEWLEQASLWYEMYCHDLEGMNSNRSWVELGLNIFFSSQDMIKGLAELKAITRVQLGVHSTSAISCA